MAASVVDALVITLGLDASNFDKGRKKVEDGLKKTKDGAGDTAKYMEAQGKRAAGFFSSIRNELLALAGVTLSVHGLTSFVKSTTNGLMNMSIQSKALGISARSLDGWAKAATAAGSSAEKITGTLGNFQNAIQAFRSGDASSPIFKALALLNADTGVSFNPATQDADSMLRSVSTAIQKERNPDRARYIAQQLGIDDATLQSMRSGKFLSNANRFAGASGVSDKDIENARKFTEQWTTLQQKLEKVSYTIFFSLSPYIDEFTRYLLKLSDWINQHPKEINEAIQSFFDGVKEFAKAADDAAKAVGGWNNAILLLIGATVGIPLLTFIGNLTKALSGILAITPPAWVLAAAGIAGASGYEAYQQGKALLTGEQYGGFQSQSAEMSELERLKRSNWAKNNPGVPYPEVKMPTISASGKALLGFMSGDFGMQEAKYRLPSGLLNSMAMVESSGNPNAIGPKTKYGRAQGLFQFMPATAKELGIDPMDPKQATEGAARFMRMLLDENGGDLEKALYAYNWGSGNLKRKGMENAPLETKIYAPKVISGIRTGASATMPPSFSMGYQPGMGVTPSVSIGIVNVRSDAQSTERLTTDIVKNAQNRVRLLGFSSGQQ